MTSNSLTGKCLASGRIDPTPVIVRISAKLMARAIPKRRDT